jgi:hypothetical protein
MKDLQSPTPGPAIAPDIAALLDVEREVPAMPDDARDRAFARAQASLLLANQRPTKPHGRVRAPFVVAAGATLLIAAAGVAALRVQQRVDTPPAPIATSPAPRPALQDTLPPADAVAPAPPIAVRKSITGTSRKAHPRALAQASPDELPLLRKAREALGRRGFGEALATLVEHESRFPASRFVEERDALKVLSLSGLGRMEEARRAAESFRVHFPHSVLLPRMNDALP